MTSRSEGRQQGIQSVEVAMQVVEAIERLGVSAPLSQIAAEAGMSPSSTHRYLVSLTRVGLASQDVATGWYDLGPASRRLGIEAMRRSDDVKLGSAVAAQLRDVTGHAVNVSVWSESGPTIVRWEFGRYPLPITARVGSTLPLLDSSAGHVFMAYLPPSVTRSALAAQHRHRETSVVSPVELAAVLDTVRDEGLARTAGGVVLGLTALAVPVFGPGDGLALVLTAAIPTRVSKPSAESTIADALRSASDQLSADLGGRNAAEVGHRLARE